MKTFYLFLKSKRTTLLLWLIVTGIFFLVPMLYDMPLYATGYASILALVCLLIGFLLSYARFCKKHQTLKQMQKSVLYNLDALPEPKDPVEQDYIDLITLLFNEKQHFITKKEEEWKETIDYYTLWAHQIKTPIAAMRLLLQSDDASVSRKQKNSPQSFFRSNSMWKWHYSSCVSAVPPQTTALFPVNWMIFCAVSFGNLHLFLSGKRFPCNMSRSVVRSLPMRNGFPLY